jgi:hypothetical protein
MFTLMPTSRLPDQAGAAASTQHIANRDIILFSFIANLREDKCAGNPRRNKKPTNHKNRDLSGLIPEGVILGRKKGNGLRSVTVP